MRRWFPLVPEAEPGARAEAAREASLDLADLRVLYRALRVAWLAELVFGERELAHRWLCQPSVATAGCRCCCASTAGMRR